jgi:hypothetical protein
LCSAEVLQWDELKKHSMIRNDAEPAMPRVLDGDDSLRPDTAFQKHRLTTGTSTE